MPRLSPFELQEAKQRKAEQRRQAAERQQLEEAREEAAQGERQREKEERMAKERELHERFSSLTSYVDGIYEEATKLSNKRPTDDTSDRMIDRANRAIRSARELLAGENDPFLNEIEEFVPAGDPIEVRDVVLTLRQVKDSLARMKQRHYEEWKWW